MICVCMCDLNLGHFRYSAIVSKDGLFKSFILMYKLCTKCDNLIDDDYNSDHWSLFIVYRPFICPTCKQLN